MLTLGIFLDLSLTVDVQVEVLVHLSGHVGRLADVLAGVRHLGNTDRSTTAHTEEVKGQH